ncbi:MAG: hypothetical protein IJ390_04535 [Lachnospiraceae bacterium]|nr:hypothetical protein [Lachnospiraceae bacterium]
MSLKNNKFLRRMAVAVMTGAMMVSMLGMTAFAANTPAIGTNNAASITKYLVLDANAVVPTATFTYSIKAGDAVAAKAGKTEIKAGIDVGKITIGATAFDSTDTKYTAVQTGDSLTLASGKAYAKESAAIDFSQVSFTEPGVYRYVITEDNTTVEGVIKAANSIYLDVYVTSDATGALTISGYVLHNSTEIADSTTGNYTEGNEKTVGFVNTYDTGSVSLKKVLQGNQANYGTTYEFTIQVDGKDAEGTSVSETYNTNYVTDATTGATLTLTSGESETIQLAPNQTITIYGLSSSDTYTFKEKDYSAEGYTTEIEGYDEKVSTDTTGLTVTGSKGNKASDDAVVYTNKKNVTTPTGVILNIAPYIMMVALAGVLAFLFLRNKKEREF